MAAADGRLWIPYCGAAPMPGQAWGAFNADPVLLLALVAALVLARRHAAASDRRTVYAAAALVAVLFVSPLCALGSALFSVRVIHHLALVVMLAPLLARLAVVGRWARRASLPALTAVQVAVFWTWHAPPLYALALSSDAVFWAMQLSLCGSAILWWARLRQAETGPAVIALLAVTVLMGLLAALLTFAGRAFYAPHWLTTQAWGLSPLEDQQLAGLLMWVPGSAVYLLIAAALLFRSLEPEPAR